MASELHVDAIKHSGGTSALTIDSSGRVGVTNPIISWARKTDTTSYTTVGTIVWDTEMLDTAGAYNNSTGVFTCPKVGFYEVHWHYLHRANGYLTTTLQKNGSHVWGSGSQTILYSNNNDSGDQQQVSAFGVVNCSVSDTLSIRLNEISGASDFYGGSNSHNGFMIKFLG